MNLKQKIEAQRAKLAESYNAGYQHGLKTYGEPAIYAEPKDIYARSWLQGVARGLQIAKCLVWQGNYVAFELDRDVVWSVPRQGPADDVVRELLEDDVGGCRTTLEALDFGKVVRELLDYGAWEAKELEADPGRTLGRLLWLAALDLQEGEG